MSVIPKWDRSYKRKGVNKIMLQLKRKIVTGIASGAILLGTITPAFAATTITVNGNGENSVNTVDTSASSTTNKVNQTNYATVTNTVTGTASTGGNTATSNTGGNTAINTGAASATSNVATAANVNSANVGCGCNNGATTVTLSGNGQSSQNFVTAGNTTTNTLNQNNTATVTNTVHTSANSGDNLVDGSTGGNVSIITGPATATSNVVNAVNGNMATIGSGSNTAGGYSAYIYGNGENSVSNINLDGSSATTMNQSNNSNIRNDVTATANSGGNSATSNTGGSVLVTTGAANANASVTNLPNFNVASGDCGCAMGGLTATIGGNGEFSNNFITAGPTSTTAVGQASTSLLGNTVNPTATSGDNLVDGSTGNVNGLSTFNVITGNSNQSATVTNAGNANVYGNITLPSWFISTSTFNNLQTSFDMSGLLNWWNSMFHA